jgi:hypothetical protein
MSELIHSQNVVVNLWRFARESSKYFYVLVAFLVALSIEKYCDFLKLFKLKDFRQKKSPHARHERIFRIVGDASKPGFVVDNHSSRPEITRRLKRSTRPQRGPRHMRAYLILLRVEFTLQPTVTSGPVRSYRTLSALPVLTNEPSAVFSLLHLSSVYTAQALPGTLPCGARTFLPL